MDVKEVVKITNHKEAAVERLPQQYKDTDKFKRLIAGLGARAQTVEDSAYELLYGRTLINAIGAQLDGIGQIVKQPRLGLDDETYRIRLIAKIAENVSDGTAESLIKLFKLLMQADKIYFYELFPAAVYMIAAGGTPIGSLEEVKKAVLASKAGGVSIDILASASDDPFSFLEDPDVNGHGFGSLDDPDEGGYFTQII